ncbi:MAG: hypothetical protein ACYCYK_09345 [Candidatus Dormibacteria bacterium]
MIAHSAGSPRRADILLFGAALLGALDVGSFLLVRRRQIFRAAPGRASGSVAGLLLWSGLGVASWGEASGCGSRRLHRLTTSLAVVCGLGNLALLAVHFKIGKGQRRSLFGGALGAAALGLAVRRRRPR